MFVGIAEEIIKDKDEYNDGNQYQILEIRT